MTEELFSTMCDQIAAGESIRNVMRENGISGTDWYGYISKNESASLQYARSLEIRTAADADMIETAARDSIDAVQQCDPKSSGAVAQAYRLLVDTHKWTMSKRCPKKYGDSVQQKITDGDGAPLSVVFNVPRPPTV